MNINLRKSCEFFGFTVNHENESILIFHSCSTNIYLNTDGGYCDEKHIGNTPRSIMTKGNSVANGTRYGNFIKGNRDKLMISYRREQSHDYIMHGACGVLFEGEIHFFGGWHWAEINLSQQHFVIETKRSGQLVKMTKKEDLGIGFVYPSCGSFEMTSEYFPWFKTNVVILCFNYYHQKSCYSFDGQLTYIGDSNHEHYMGGLAKYKTNLLTVGGLGNNQKTEILKIYKNKNFSWSIVESEFEFTLGQAFFGHSMVTVESSDINEENVLLIGGYRGGYVRTKDVFKFNGTWFPFGQLNKPRRNHNSIYWNGAVYVIGGEYGVIGPEYIFNYNTKMEIWNIKESPDKFKTKENWPELFRWRWPHLFIVPDSFFPDR